MVRVLTEKIQNRQKEDKRFEGKGGVRSAALAEGSQMGQIEHWRYTSWRSPRRKSQCWQV